jgi:hypothetical protein
MAKKQEESDTEDAPATESTQENIATQSEPATSEYSQEESVPTPPDQPIRTRASLIMSREVAIKVCTFIVKIKFVCYFNPS